MRNPYIERFIQWNHYKHSMKSLHICNGIDTCMYRAKRKAPAGQTHQNKLAQMIDFHTNLTNLTDGASLRPRLSALPSVFSRMASTSDGKCSS